MRNVISNLFASNENAILTIFLMYLWLNCVAIVVLSKHPWVLRSRIKKFLGIQLVMFIATGLTYITINNASLVYFNLPFSLIVIYYAWLGIKRIIYKYKT